MISIYKFTNQSIKTKGITTKFVFYLICILSSNFISAQSPSVEWQKSFGGSNAENGQYIRQTNDGGYIVAGHSESIDGDVIGNHGGADYWILKLSSTGTVQWKKTYGGTNNEYARSINQTVDGGYIVAGTSNSNDGDVSGGHGNNDYWILKISSVGNIEWQKTIGGSSNDVANIAIQTSDGGYVVGGYTNSTAQDVTDNNGGFDYWIVKLSEIGTIQWQKTYGGTADDRLFDMQQTTDGGYIMSGHTLSNDGDVTSNHGIHDVWIVKTSDIGVIEWQKTLGGTADDYGYKIEQTTDGGYLVGGNTNSNDGDVTSNHGGLDFWLIKLLNNGTIEWQKTLGGTADDISQSIQQTLDGGYIVAGFSRSSNGDVMINYGSDDYWIVKLTADGIIQWQKTIGGTGADHCYSIRQTADSGYILSGLSYSNNNDITLNQGQSDCWIVKLAPSSLDILNLENITLKIYPNPVHDVINFELSESITKVKITDLNGRLLIEKQGIKIKEVDVSVLKSAIYFIQINTYNGVAIKKFIKE